MPSGLVNVEAGRLLDLSIGDTPATAAPVGDIKLALSSAATSASAAGTEVTAGSGRATITFTGAGTLSTGTTSNAAILNFTSMPVATTTDVNLYDSAGTPRRLWWGTLTTQKTTASGDTLSFAIGAVTVTFNSTP